jgi:hypothetical protein
MLCRCHAWPLGTWSSLRSASHPIPHRDSAFSAQTLCCISLPASQVPASCTYQERTRDWPCSELACQGGCGIHRKSRRKLWTSFSETSLSHISYPVAADTKARRGDCDGIWASPMRGFLQCPQRTMCKTDKGGSKGRPHHQPTDWTPGPWTKEDEEQALEAWDTQVKLQSRHRTEAAMATRCGCLRTYA